MSVKNDWNQFIAKIQRIPLSHIPVLILGEFDQHFFLQIFKVGNFDKFFQLRNPWDTSHNLSTLITRVLYMSFAMQIPHTLHFWLVLKPEALEEAFHNRKTGRICALVQHKVLFSLTSLHTYMYMILYLFIWGCVE